jgi:N-acetylglucosaminyldiphosphoundecaprenol N-acetyl-beta-D-mannosaminyltransferase
MINLASKSLSKPPNRAKISVLGVSIDDICEKDAILQILKMAKDPKGHHFVATVNSEFIMMAKRDKKFENVLKTTDLNLPDSAGVVLAKLILGGKEKSRVTGTDLIEKLCEKSANLPITVGFLGGFGKVAPIVAKRQQARFPGLEVVFAVSGDPAIGYDLRLKQDIFASKRVDLVFVAYGMGTQEFWISRNKDKLNAGVFIGVGGGFDYQSEAKARSPRFLQNVGLEWLWRLLFEPQRIWRMRVLPLFAVLVILQFLKRFSPRVVKN